MNYVNIQEKRTVPEPTPSVTVEQPHSTSPTVITIIRDVTNPTPTPELNVSPSLAPSPTICLKEIGPIAIRSPEENATVTSNPLQIFIDYDQGDYCSVVWSYRLNDGTWSEYGDNDIVIYNLPSGKKTLELRVKSIASPASKTLKRTFTYTNPQETITPTSTPTPTPTI